ncbi:30S ribosomal protein S6 [Candidatus Vidania fulgoroideorum]
MKFYEIVVILKPYYKESLSLINELVKIINRNSKMINMIKLSNRKLSYSIKGFTKAIYYFILSKLNFKTLRDIYYYFRYKLYILRYFIIKLKKVESYKFIE